MIKYSKFHTDKTSIDVSPSNRHAIRSGNLTRSRTIPLERRPALTNGAFEGRTKSLSDELVAHLRSAVGASKGAQELDVKELTDLRKLLNGIHDEIDTALVNLAMGTSKSDNQA